LVLTFNRGREIIIRQMLRKLKITVALA